VLERSILGNESLFEVPPYALVHAGELLGYALLGIVGGIVSVLFCKGLLRARAWFLGLPSWTLTLRPAAGGALIGLILLFVPEVMGVGYAYVGQALQGQLLLQTLLLLGVVKLVATIISYASGNAGGIFAPSLFIGAMVGGATGALMRAIAPFPVGETGAYALVGMGTLFAGIIRAPMTSVFMIFELTQDYQIVVPLMIANMISLMISRHYQPAPVYHALLAQDHVHLPARELGTALHRRRVSAIMERQFPALSAATTVAAACEQTRQWSGHCFPVLDGKALAGLVTIELLERARAAGETERLLSELPLLADPAHVHPDHSLGVALGRISQNPGILPVVSRKDARRLEGVISLDSILKALQSS